MNRGLPIAKNLNRGGSRRKARRRAECGCTNLCGPPREPPWLILGRFLFTEHFSMEPHLLPMALETPLPLIPLPACIVIQWKSWLTPRITDNNHAK